MFHGLHNGWTLTHAQSFWCRIIGKKVGDYVIKFELVTMAEDAS